MEQIMVYFTNGGVPATGLSPIVEIMERNGTLRVSGGQCAELGNGFYIYNFDLYSSEKQYAYLFDGGSTLSAPERYKPGNNELDSYSNRAARGRTVAATVNYDPIVKAIKDHSPKPMELPAPDKRIDILLEAIKGLKIPNYDKNIEELASKLGLIEEKIEMSNAELSGGTKSSGDAIISLIHNEITPNVIKKKKKVNKSKATKEKIDIKPLKEKSNNKLEEVKKRIGEREEKKMEEDVLKILEQDDLNVLNIIESAPSEEEILLSLLK